MSHMIEKIRSLKIFPLFGERYAEKTDIVSRLEAELTLKLPASYAECLSFFNRTSGFDTEVSFQGLSPSPWASGGKDKLDVWYGDSQRSQDIFSVRRSYEEQIPPSFLIIGEAPATNLICMRLDTPFSEILLWDHEEPDEELAFYSMAPSFENFIERLTAT